MLSNSQQSRVCTFLIKLIKRIKMLQVKFTKYAKKYIPVCLWQQKPPLRSAAVLTNQRSSQVLKEEFVVDGEWEE